MKHKHSIEKLSWDSDFFNFEVGECIVNNDDFNWKAICEDAKRNDFQLIYIKSKNEILDLDLPSDCEAKLVDKKITYTINLEQSSIKPQHKNIRSFAISEHSTNELNELSIIAGEYSRFKVDAKISEEKFTTLYKLWMENSVNRSFANEVLVYYDDLDKISGMITIQLKENYANIGLLSVDHHHQGKGIGSVLIEAAFSYMQENEIGQAEVVTQLDNKNACNFYLKNGFVKKSLEYIYHLWL